MIKFYYFQENFYSSSLILILRSATAIDGEEVSITFKGDDVIVICKEVEVIETV